MIVFLDRKTKKRCVERVYGDKALRFLYKKNYLSKTAALFLAKISLFSKIYGWIQKTPLSRRKVAAFIKTFAVDASEFLDPVSSFNSFNAFFCRKLKAEARPLASSDALIPADGRFLFYPRIDLTDGFLVKGEKFDLATLLQNEEKARLYEKGSLVIARLCPSDYHRFHFPCDCTPSLSNLINGFLFSVNPIAVKKNIHIFTENKRCITELQTELFGKVLYIEIGATCVGSIHQTYTPLHSYKKGDEKGFFSFGGSSILLLFEQNKIIFDSDLISASSQGIEILCLMGQSMGSAIKK